MVRQENEVSGMEWAAMTGEEQISPGLKNPVGARIRMGGDQEYWCICCVIYIDIEEFGVKRKMVTQIPKLWKSMKE